MDALTIIQVSDSHLSPSAPRADEQWSAVVAEIGRRSPDLVVHTGDITLDGAHEPADLVHARTLLDRLPVPWLAIPGNHDIGDVSDSNDPVDDVRRRHYDDVFGAASWVDERKGWRLVGVDVQTLSSDLSASDRMWTWLERIMQGRRPTALFVHRPILPLAVDEVDDPRRYLPRAARARLMTLIGEHHVTLVGTGHVHQWRSTERSGCLHVWAPSTWASLPDEAQPTIGSKVTGVVELVLQEGAAAKAELVRPVGVDDLVIGHDFPSPYGH